MGLNKLSPTTKYDFSEYDFDLFKGFSMEKLAQIHQIFKFYIIIIIILIIFPNRHIFMISSSR